MPTTTKRSAMDLIARIRVPRLHVRRLVKAALRYGASPLGTPAQARLARESDKH